MCGGGDVCVVGGGGGCSFLIVSMLAFPMESGETVLSYISFMLGWLLAALLVLFCC